MPPFRFSGNIAARMVALDAVISSFTQYHGTLDRLGCRHFGFWSISRYDWSLRMPPFRFSVNITERMVALDAVISSFSQYHGTNGRLGCRHYGSRSISRNEWPLRMPPFRFSGNITERMVA
ncbi:hypothetical protein [Rossellomorea sp. BNER]|uniref:hypothetical protein n=1 Tax=Rossellomorea sp. BNER TaxID=2962031 RepID=UPI003AF22C27|nr:hypothetical protein [Rossellomorea sp. BNER]